MIYQRYRVSTCSVDSPVLIYKLDIKVLNLYAFINPSASFVVNNGFTPFVVCITFASPTVDTVTDNDGLARIVDTPYTVCDVMVCDGFFRKCNVTLVFSNGCVGTISLTDGSRSEQTSRRY